MYTFHQVASPSSLFFSVHFFFPVFRKREYSIRIPCLDLESLIHCAPLDLIAIMVKAMNTGRDQDFT